MRDQAGWGSNDFPLSVVVQLRQMVDSARGVVLKGGGWAHDDVIVGYSHLRVQQQLEIEGNAAAVAAVARAQLGINVDDPLSTSLAAQYKAICAQLFGPAGQEVQLG